MIKHGVVTSATPRQTIAPLTAPPTLQEIRIYLGVEGVQPGLLPGRLPFSAGDSTAGSETELQAVVLGSRESVDLPLMIEQSNYYANIFRRAAAGDLPRRAITDLEKYLGSNTEQLWDNSWVRFPRRHLGGRAAELLDRDLRVQRSNPDRGYRTDCDRFVFSNGGEEWLRIPLSYLLRLTLAQVTEKVSPLLCSVAERLMDHFLSDNTSPETHSFHIATSGAGKTVGSQIARETTRRYLMTQLLVSYANQTFRLKALGQEARVFFSPHPPVRQRSLNTVISDSFYRELFMNPCLSGWDKGEEKHSYMHLCHEILSRSQLNAVAKLREAGILRNNLIVLPTTSTISLANNGTHLSLGSLMLGERHRGGNTESADRCEKYAGDLVLKIMEHFLPLFVGTYSAAPYRLDFADFHPEKVLGYLPHELDYTHLRMFWRRWRKKASLKIFGQPVTPFGPTWLDRGVSMAFGLKGDFVTDFRLIDYMVALMSTQRSPALDGMPGNEQRLKHDLADLGVFDRRMALYQFCKLREHRAMGFSGFEGRHYSLFESLTSDLAGAAGVQNLLTSLAFQYIATGSITHEAIPDDPFIESERRQVIFAVAAGIPTFYVRNDSRNSIVMAVVKKTAGVRSSSRYPGYLRVPTEEYRRALLAVIRNDGADLIENLEMGETMSELEARLDSPGEHATVNRLTSGICNEAGARTPLSLTGSEFNQAAERYYRETLRKRHMEEAFIQLEEDLRQLDGSLFPLDALTREALRHVVGEKGVLEFFTSLRPYILSDQLPEAELRALIHLLLTLVHNNDHATEHACDQNSDTPSVPTA
jgi:hypothetical protein